MFKALLPLSLGHKEIFFAPISQMQTESKAMFFAQTKG
jgi:hypothetical protein